MTYKAPLSMRLFQYVLWGVMALVIAWFFIIPLFFRATAPEPGPQISPPVPATSPVVTPDTILPAQENSGGGA